MGTSTKKWKENRMDKISVIVPVWNAHEYLNRCVDSILAQTYENLEVLLVDDGSADDSLSICRQYAEQDRRVRVFHKDNGGQASARNYALDRATGDYIGFVDNDDWILPNMYERLHQLMIDHDADVGRCGDMQGKMEESATAENAAVLVTEAEEYFPLLYQDIWGGHVTDRLFRREVIGDSRFPCSKTIEDMRFMRILLPKIRREVATDEKLFFYTIRQDSTSMIHAKTYVNSYERAEEYQSRYRESLELHPECSRLLLYKSVRFACGAMKALILTNGIKSPEYQKMRDFMKRYKKEILSLRELAVKYRLFVLVMA